MATLVSESGNVAPGAALGARLSLLERDAGRLSPSALGRSVAALADEARAARLDAVARIAGSLGRALAVDGRAAIVRPYLAGMREALGSGVQDDATADRLLASVQVRLVG